MSEMAVQSVIKLYSKSRPQERWHKTHSLHRETDRQIL